MPPNTGLSIASSSPGSGSPPRILLLICQAPLSLFLLIFEFILASDPLHLLPGMLVSRSSLGWLLYSHFCLNDLVLGRPSYDMTPLYCLQHPSCQCSFSPWLQLHKTRYLVYPSDSITSSQNSPNLLWELKYLLNEQLNEWRTNYRVSITWKIMEITFFFWDLIFFAILGFKLRAYTLSHSTSHFLWRVFSR
jgi:hypothetical protein